ncbi:MAG TPA: squalene/phytoene synthase family protein [Dongiaceae bacterium]|nr:squalene/phytoene synthase family protein [Dongiaceae bacterium]
MGADHFDYCLDQVRQGDRDRYLILLFAPSAARGHLAALAAFNLELARAREQTSESLLALIRLQWWREAIEEIRAGGKVRQHQVATALAETTRVCGLNTDLMLAMIEARESESEQGAPDSEAVFLARIDATAGNLLRLSLQALRLESQAPAVSAAATRIGRAYATAGLLRSIVADARRRQVRLPLDRLGAAGVNVDRLYDLKPQAQLMEFVRGLAEEAAADLAAARRGDLPRAAKPLTLTARIAAMHLRRLRQADYDPFHPSLGAAHPMDAWHLLWTSLSGRF